MIQPPPTDRPRIHLWAYGGGLQSQAIALLILQGHIPKPDLIVICDTSRERTATWDYLHNYTAPALAAIGLTVDIAPHDLSKYDLFNKDYCLIPYYVANGKHRNTCTSAWKRDVLPRWIRQRHPEVKAFWNWLGFSHDEIRRVKPDRDKWRAHWYPLIDLGISRAGCAEIVHQAGWPRPPKTCCYMCPHTTNDGWRWLRDNYPQDWQAAIATDRDIRQRTPHAYVHRQLVPLDQADIEPNNLRDTGECELGYCFI